jgi:hypothetical protein
MMDYAQTSGDTPPRATARPLLDPAAWAETTFGTVALGDARRTARAVTLAEALAARPAASLPAAVGDPAALKAAYRLLHEPDVTAAALSAPHRAQTLAAARDEAVVLLVQDTTELDYTHHRATADLGPIGNGRGRGYLLQSVLAVTPGKTVLGLAHLAPFRRVPAPRRGERCDERRDRPRESDVWGRTARELGPPPDAARWVHVGDRGADVFTFFAACRAVRADVLVRVAQDRRATTADGAATRVLVAARAAPAAATRPLAIPTRPGHPARTATVAVAWVPLVVQPPADVRDGEPLPAWVVRVWEPAPPVGSDPVEWVLLTSVPVADVDAAWERVDWYGGRWLVEEYHRCLKTGCRLEASQLRDLAALWRLLGLRAPIAVRLLILRQTARSDPDQPATTVVPAEVVAIVAAKTRQPAAGMTVRTCWRLIARLGGHQGRRHDGEPGWQTLWSGWLYVQTLLEGARLARDLVEPRCG